MATRTLTALFDTYDHAAEAVRQLEAAGIAHGDISIVSNDASHQRFYGDDSVAGTTGASGGFGTTLSSPSDYAAGATTSEDHTGTGTGASLGTILGGGAGLLAGLGMLAIPGLGPVVAAGWLASMLLGAGVGAAAGGVVGALTGAGVSETDAHSYAEGVKRGGTLVTVRADDALVDRAAEILDREHTVDMNDRETNWRGEGWSGSYTQPDINSGSLGYADADRATVGAATTPAASTTSTIGGAAAGVGAAASRAGERLESAVGRVGRSVDNAVSGTGTPVGVSDVEPAAVPSEAGAVYEGTRIADRGRVRVYGQR